MPAIDHSVTPSDGSGVVDYFVADDTNVADSTFPIGGLAVSRDNEYVAAGGTTNVHTRAHPTGFKTIVPPSARTRTPLTVATGQWYEIPNTALAPHITTSNRPGDIFGNWTGGCPIPALRMTIYPPGGGHFGNSASTFYYFDWDTFAVDEMYPPSPIVGTVNGDGVPNNWYPSAQHWYGGMTPYLDPRDGYWKGLFCGTAETGWLVDPINKTVEHISDGVGATGLRAAYDSYRNIPFFHTTGPQNQLYHYEAVRNRWFRHSYGDNADTYDYYADACYDPLHDRIITLSTDHYVVGVLPISALIANHTAGMTQTAWTNNGTPFIAGAKVSVTWDSIAGDFVLQTWNADYSHCRLYRMDPLTFVITDIGDGGPDVEGNGTWGRFWHDPVRDLFFTVQHYNENHWAFKRDRSSTPSAPPAPPPIGSPNPPPPPTPPPVSPSPVAPPPITAPSPVTPSPVGGPPPSPPPSGSHFIRFTLGTNASGATAVAAQVFTRDGGGLADVKLFNVSNLTLPAAVGGLVTVNVPVPSNVSVTAGQTVKAILKNASYSSFLIDGLVV